MKGNVSFSGKEWLGPIFLNARENLEKITLDAAKTIYGDKLPAAVKERLDREFSYINDDIAATVILIAKLQSDFVKENGGKAWVRGKIPGSFIAYILGITEINPLKPHYFCEKCGHFMVADGERDCFSLPRIKCPVCGEETSADGHNIRAELFFNLGKKLPSIDIIIPESLHLQYLGFLSDKFGKDKIALAALGETVIPNRIMIISKERAFADIVPLKENRAPFPAIDGDWREFSEVLYMQNYTLGEELDALASLEKETGKDIKDINFADAKIYDLFRDGDTDLIPGFDGDIVKDILIEANPMSFSDLVKVCGAFHGTCVWSQNIEELLSKGICEISDIPTTTDELIDYLVARGAEYEDAIFVMRHILRGSIAKETISADDIAKFREIISDANVPEWFEKYCSKIRYIFSKGYSVAICITAVRAAWFKVYYPEQFERVFGKLNNT